MDPASREPGLALVCDPHGVILKVIADSLPRNSPLATGSPLSAVFDAGSLDKFRRFLDEVQSDGSAFDWELDVHGVNSLESLFFTGVRSGADVLILGAKTVRGAVRFQNDLMAMDNDLANGLRAALKEVAGQGSAEPREVRDFYNELARVNNDLANAQRELARKSAELERLNRQKTRFLGMAAHDLRTPIGVILSYSDFLLEEAGSSLTAEHREFVETIRESSEFMLELINDVLDLTAIDSGELKLRLAPADLNAMIGRNVAINRILAGKRDISIAFQHETAPLIFPFDQARLTQVLNNLIGNAIKYSAQSTAIVVGVTRVGNEAVIEVKDQGPGIPPGELNNLFKPFSKTSVKSQSGEQSTGLGLAISKRIVDGHHGRIWVQSEVGVGTSFFVALPLAMPAANEG